MPFVFDAKAVVVDGGKNREHDATTELADGKVTVTEKNHRVIAAIPYSAIVGISHSNSKQPLWNSPAGPGRNRQRSKPARSGFSKAAATGWPSAPRTQSLVLRVDDESLRRVIAALEERTRQKVARVVEKD